MSNTALITQDIVLLNDDDTETVIKVDKVNRIYGGYKVTMPAWSDQANPVEQQNDYDGVDWQDNAYYEIGGSNYETIDAFIRRIAYLKDRDLSTITDGELDGYYIAHRNLELRTDDEYNRYVGDALVVYTRAVIDYDDDGNEVTEVQATVIRAEQKYVGRWT